MATGEAVPAFALGAMAGVVTARVQRLAEAPGWARHTCYGVALLTVTRTLALAPALAATFTAPLAAHGIAAL